MSNDERRPDPFVPADAGTQSLPRGKSFFHSRGCGNPVFAKSKDFDLRQRLGLRVRGDERTVERLPSLCDFLTGSCAGTIEGPGR
jgi:hypothetical protein